MSRVLVVDDEQDYCDELEVGLGRRGHEVRTAATGREAIRLGIRYRPDVLVADWMLKESLHGLHVCEALRTFAPEVQTILITGFASCDLKSKALENHIFRFLEKPFTLDEIYTAVRDAASARTPQRPRFLPAVVAVDSTGTITHANSRAGELFAQIRAGEAATTLAELFGPSAIPDFEVAAQRWVKVSPVAEQAVTWHLRSKKLPDGGWLFVLLDGEQPYYSRSHRVVRTLLEVIEPVHAPWPLEGRLLVIDHDATIRHRLSSELEARRCICHAADTHETALALFKRDPGIKFVTLDPETPGGEVRVLVRNLKTIRPDVTIVGSSGQDRREALAAAGVERFLRKPWTVEDLINLLTGRMGNCGDCELPIPLRRPQPGEVARSWVCAGCGSRYFAVLDDDFPPDVISNVRPAERVDPRINCRAGPG